MKKQVLSGALGALLVVSLVAPVTAATSEVTVSDNRFSPDRVTVRVGDSVEWSRAQASRGSHNIREDNSIFRSGTVTAGAISFARRFSAGTFHYYCEIHGSRRSGMDGLVRVPVTIVTAPSGLAFTVKWATGTTNTGTRFDVQYRVASGAWRNWKSDTAATDAVFGRAGQPLTVKAGTVYSFRARSQKRDAESGWSPVKTLKA